MNLYAFFGGTITFQLILDFCIRVILSVASGVLIGAERAKRYKEAGIRTHVLVAMTACILMIISKYGFVDLVNSDGTFLPSVKEADPARIAAQIVSGVGFLGAGVIFRNGNSVKGLTTAAGIWATAAIGMCYGTGMYYLGIIAVVVIVILQKIIHKFPYGIDGYATNHVTIKIYDPDRDNKVLKDLMSRHHIKITETSIKRNDEGMTTYHLTVLSASIITFEECEKFMEEYPDIKSFASIPVV